MLYVQIKYDVIMGKMDLEVEDAIELGALQLMINYEQDNEVAYKFLDRNLSDYVPMDLYSREQPTTWIKNIFDRYRDLPEHTKNEAKTKYLEYVSKNPLYMAHQYQVNFSESFNNDNNESLPKELILGVRKDGLILCDKNRKELLFINYSHVASWGVNSSVFVVVVQKTEYELRKVYLESFNTKMLQLLVCCYTSLLTGQGISEVLYNVYDSIKMFENMARVKLNPGESARSKMCTSFKKYIK